MRKEAREKYPHLYEKYKEKNREQAREYYRLNKEKISDGRRGNEEFMFKRRIYFNQWKKDNADKFNTIIYNWKSTGSGIYSLFSRNARQRGIEVTISREVFMRWYEKQVQICEYCGLTINQIKALPDWYVRRSGAKRFSIDRKDNNKGYNEENIVLSCYMCNTIKNSFIGHAEMEKIGKIILKPKLQKMLKEIK